MNTVFKEGCAPSWRGQRGSWRKAIELPKIAIVIYSSLFSVALMNITTKITREGKDHSPSLREVRIGTEEKETMEELCLLALSLLTFLQPQTTCLVMVPPTEGQAFPL